MLRLVSALLCLLLIAACAETELPAGKRGRIFKLADEERQAFAIARLEERNIPYVVDSEGFIQTIMADQAKVDGIRREATYGSELNSSVWESEIIANADMRHHYESAFSEASIQYTIRSDEGIESIEWNQLDGPKLDAILHSVDEERMDRLLNESKSQ